MLIVIVIQIFGERQFVRVIKFHRILVALFSMRKLYTFLIFRTRKQTKLANFKVGIIC